MNTISRLWVSIPWYVAALLASATFSSRADDVGEAIRTLESRGFKVIDVTTADERAFIVSREFGIAATDEDMRAIATLDRIRTLNLSISPELTDDGLGALSEIKELGSIYASFSKITGTGFSKLERVKGLKVVFLFQSQVSDQSVGSFADLPELEDLNLYECCITDHGLKKIASFSTLRKLHVGNCPITDEGVQHLALLPELLDLGVGAKGLSAKGLRSLAKCPKLRALSISQLPEGWLESIRTFPLLTQLTVIGKLSAASCEGLESINGLEELVIVSSEVEDAVADQIAKCPHIRRLGVSGKGFGTGFFARLASSASLKTIDLLEFRNFDADLIQASLPRITLMTRVDSLSENKP